MRERSRRGGAPFLLVCVAGPKGSGPPVVPWNRVLRSIVRRAIADVAGRVQFTYSSRRAGRGNGMIFPSMRGRACGLSVVVDTSEFP